MMSASLRHIDSSGHLLRLALPCDSDVDKPALRKSATGFLRLQHTAEHHGSLTSDRSWLEYTARISLASHRMAVNRGPREPLLHGRPKVGLLWRTANDLKLISVQMSCCVTLGLLPYLAHCESTLLQALDARSLDT